MNEPLILASQSPRRKQLLELAEIHFEVIVQETDETFPNDLSIEEVPMYIAKQKATIIQKEYPLRRILAADTIVVLDHEIIGKPKDRDDAIQILGKLAGRTHRVITGVVLLEGDQERSFSDCTDVCFRELSQSQIEYYVDTYQPFDKAGAYAIQEWIGAIAIHSIHGCFYNVMGLPISKLIPIL